jgi:hypothetical protein
MRLHNLKALACCLLIVLCCPAFPQSVSPDASNQPSDLHLVLTTKDGRTQFRLGEIIELDLAYSSDVPGKYLLLSLPAKIKGHSARTIVAPSERVIDRFKDQGYRSVFAIMHVNCGWGSGGGIGSGCGDCDNAWPLNAIPIRFPYSLTNQFQITEAGRISVKAEAASVVVVPLHLETSRPISVTSNTLEITIVDDPSWAHARLEQAMADFKTAHSKYTGAGWDMIPEEGMPLKQWGKRWDLQAQMQKAAEVMRGLDTKESLAEAVKLYDGIPQYPDYYKHVVWSAIIQSKHQELAVKLLATRIVDPDFAVTPELLDQLTAMALEVQFPGSLASEDAGSRRRYYPAARKLLQDYVLDLGKSLEEKRPGALESSLQAFKRLAREDFCDGQPLVPERAFNQMLRSVKAFDNEEEH